MSKNLNAKIRSREVVGGNVKITLLSNKNNREVRTITGHNTGTIYICEYLRDALSGDYVINNRPGTIVPCVKTGSGQLRNLTNGITYQGEIKKNSFEITDAGCSVTLTFLIPSTFSSLTEIAGFRLYSYASSETKKEDKDLYAEIDLTKQEDYDPNDPLIIESGVNLKVEWTLAVRFE